MKRCLVVLVWTLICYVLIELAFIYIFITMVFTHYDVSSSPYPYYWAIANIVSFPILIGIFSLYEHSGKLPRLYFRKDKIGQTPALLLSGQTIKKGLGIWLIFGLLPFIAYVLLFAGNDRFLTFLPAAIMYMEFSMVAFLFRAMKMPPQMTAPYGK
jgi:hypothetical protein